MGFVDELRDALRNPPGPAAPEGFAPVPPEVLAEARAAAARALADAPGRTPAWALDPAAFRARLARAWASLGEGLFGAAPAPERRELLVAAVCRALVGESTSGSARDDEVARLVDLLQTVGWRHPPTYLAELGALDATATRRTSLGDALLGLRGREFVLALCQAEAAQSAGDEDAFRLPRWVFRELARGTAPNAAEWPDLGRLVAFGVLTREQAFLEVDPTYAGHLAAAAEEASPLGILVRSALADGAPTARGAPGSGAEVRQLGELVAHELGNALSPLALLADQLDRDVPGHGAVAKLRTVTGRLAAFAKELAVLAPDREPFALVRLVDLVQDALDATAPERNGSLEVRFSVPDLRAEVRGARVRLALQNLLRNAAQAAARAGRRLQVRIDVRAAEGELRVAVEDDGPGVPGPIRGTLFERGVSGRGATGLGLALVRDVAREHGGDAVHEVPAGGGARFLLRLEVRCVGS